jgi:hypothetical protein
MALVWISAASGVLIAVGCSLNKDQLTANQVITRIGGRQGEHIEPKRCLLEVAIVTRPIRDKVINESVWNAADVQCTSEEARRSLDANGVRIGKIIGALPPDLESALHAPPPHKVEPAAYLPEINEAVDIRPGEIHPRLNLLMNLDNRAVARDYELAAGILRASTDHDGGRGVSLRIVPEIHHGPVKQGYQPIKSVGPYPNNQMTITNSQQKDSLLDLASTIVLQPGEVAVLGCDANRDRTLGSFLFTFDEANSDRKLQHLVLIWASRNKSGTIEADKLHSSVDRPTDSRPAKLEPEGGKAAAEKLDDAFKKDVGVKDKNTDKPSAR